MADLLSQEEVDLLLNAVSSGDVEAEQPSGYEQVDSRDVLTYDFRRPERVSKEQLKGLQSQFEAFAREMSIALPLFLRTVVRVDLLTIDPLTYDEFILSVSRPTCLAKIDMSPLEGLAVLEVSPTVIYPIVDRVLGGKGEGLAKPRDLTEIEGRIAQRILELILDCLKRSWDQLIEFKCKVESLESDPLLVQIVAGQEMVILVGYEVHLGEAVGTLNLCIPLVVLNPVFEYLTARTRFIRRMSPDMAERMRQVITQAVDKASTPVDAILGRAELKMRELAELQVGDIIQLDQKVADPLAVEVGGIQRFEAQPGRVAEHSAFQITDIVRD
jgi:flagellar motor switch protein FliM